MNGEIIAAVIGATVTVLLAIGALAVRNEHRFTVLETKVDLLTGARPYTPPARIRVLPQEET